MVVALHGTATLCLVAQEGGDDVVLKLIMKQRQAHLARITEGWLF